MEIKVTPIPSPWEPQSGDLVWADIHYTNPSGTVSAVALVIGKESDSDEDRYYVFYLNQDTQATKGIVSKVESSLRPFQGEILLKQ